VIDKALFKVADQQQARQQLNLPLDVPLIGTAGGLTKMKELRIYFEHGKSLSSEIHKCI
jgi:hypothetical protein